MSITVATWNVEWATPSSSRGPRVVATIADANADVVVVTEGVRGVLPADGFVIDAGDDWGYGLKPERRKVIVWSRFSLSRDFVGSEGATRDRLAVATAATPDGPVRIIGVCIPWQDAHVRSGRSDAQPWSEHLDYLNRLENLLTGLDDDVPTVIAGDFNQRIPRGRQPLRVFDRICEVLSGWTIHTAGTQPNGPHIDHIASDARLACEAVRDWSASDQLGRLSDHAGVVCRLAVAGETDGVTKIFEEATNADQEEGEGDTMAIDDSTADFEAGASGPVLTPELRAEIESILRRAPDGFEHGVGFRLRERGLTDTEIVNISDGTGTSRPWLNSLDRLLNGIRPTSKSAALDTSYAYRELFNHHRSDELDRYARAWLHELKTINPAEVNFTPLKTRQRKHKPPQRKTMRAEATEQCPVCGTYHAGEC